MKRLFSIVLSFGFCAADTVDAADPAPRFNYFFVNAGQPAVLDLEEKRFSLGDEAMSVADCSTSTMACFSIPFLSITVAMPASMPGAGEWRAGGRLFCLRRSMAVAPADTVYSVSAGAEAESCDRLAPKSDFAFSSKRGALSFAKRTDDGGAIVFVLVDSAGFGRR